MPKHLKRAAIALSSILLLLSVAGYLVWTHVSALMVIRRFVKETGIPVDVKSASWDMRLKELMNGKIRNLKLDFVYRPLNLPVSLESPVDYTKKNESWTIQLKPVLKVAAYPTTRGEVSVENTAKGATILFDLRETRPLLLFTKDQKFSAQSWKLTGRITHAEDWRGKAEATLQSVQLEDAKTKISLKSVKVESDLIWPASPPLPLTANAKTTFENIEILTNGAVIAEPRLVLKSAFDFNGHDFEHVDISVDKPFQLKTQGSLKNGALRAKFDFHIQLIEAVDKRLSQWFDSTIPLLHRAKSNGTFALSGTVELSDSQQLTTTAELTLNAKSLELPSRDLYVDDLRLKLPLSYPGLSDWGTVSAGNTEFNSVKLKNIALATRVSREGIDVTTEDDNGKDVPIRQSVWGGSIDISDFYAHVGGTEGTELAASIKGGPFKLSQIQSDLCLMPKHPISGDVSFSYPQLVRDKDSIHLMGETNLNIFNGKAHVGDLHFFLSESEPRIRFDLSWDDLDLRAIGDYTKLGDIRGSLFGGLNEASFKMTSDGPMPVSYRLTFEGRPRSGKPISFYGRAVDSVLELLMGDQKDELPWLARTLIKVGVTYYNLLPAKAEYMGFTAKAEPEWTELSTFDPPDSKEHYLLKGTSGFKIPLNTFGVYPVVMKTDAFHGWLNQKVNTLKGRMTNDDKNKSAVQTTDQNECTPLW